MIVLAFQNVEECSWEAEDTRLIFLHFCLVNIPPGIHNDLVLDGMYATLVVSEVDLSVEYWDEVRGCEDEVHSVPDGLVLDARGEPVVQGLFLPRAEPTEGGGYKVLVVQVLPGEDIVPEDADLEVPGMGNSVGGVDLPDDLLRFKGCVVDVEQVGHDSVILHVLPVIYIKLDHLAVHLAQV